jgi:hypothetical protein
MDRIRRIGNVGFVLAFWFAVAILVVSITLVGRSWWVRDRWRWTTSDLNDAQLELWRGTFRYTRVNRPHEFDARGRLLSRTAREIAHPPGRVTHVAARADSSYTPYADPRILAMARFPDRVYWAAFGVQVYRIANEKPQVDGLFNYAYFVVAPFWPLIPLSALLPLRRAHRVLAARRELRRINTGSCPHCGYDLHGLTSDRCPECGAAINGDSGLVGRD